MNAITLSLRVTAPGPAAARVSVGRRQFSVGRPVEFDDASPHVAALEYALGAVGGEVVNGLREFARRRRLPLDAIEALVTGELQGGLSYLEVIGETGQPRICRIAIKVFFVLITAAGANALAAARAAEARFRDFPDGPTQAEVKAKLIDRLPLLATLRRALDLDVELVLTS